MVSAHPLAGKVFHKSILNLLSCHWASYSLNLCNSEKGAGYFLLTSNYFLYFWGSVVTVIHHKLYFPDCSRCFPVGFLQPRVLECDAWNWPRFQLGAVQGSAAGKDRSAPLADGASVCSTGQTGSLGHGGILPRGQSDCKTAASCSFTA